jgi:ribose 5-phosphate isomerase B
MLYLASDHGGLALKENVKKYLLAQSVSFVDMGPYKLDPADDYPDYAKRVAQKIAINPARDIGLLLCRSGQGMCVAANKVKGVRAVSAWNEKLAFSTRNDDFANILCLAGDYLKPSQAKKILHKFITTPFSSAPRHKKRINKIKKLEQNFNK